MATKQQVLDQFITLSTSLGNLANNGSFTNSDRSDFAILHFRVSKANEKFMIKPKFADKSLGYEAAISAGQLAHNKCNSCVSSNNATIQSVFDTVNKSCEEMKHITN